MMWGNNLSGGGAGSININHHFNLVPEEELDYQQPQHQQQQQHQQAQHHQQQQQHLLSENSPQVFLDQRHRRLTLDAGTTNSTNGNNNGNISGNSLKSALSHVSLSFVSQRSLARSQSMGSVAHSQHSLNKNTSRSRADRHTTTSSSSGGRSSSSSSSSNNNNNNQGSGSDTALMMNETFRLGGVASSSYGNTFSPHGHGNNGGGQQLSNVFLDNSKVSSVLAAVAAAQHQQQQQHGHGHNHSQPLPPIMQRQPANHLNHNHNHTTGHRPVYPPESSSSGTAAVQPPSASSSSARRHPSSGMSGFTPINNSLASLAVSVPQAPVISVSSAHHQQHQQQQHHQQHQHHQQQQQQQQQHNSLLHQQHPPPKRHGSLASVLSESASANSVSGDEDAQRGSGSGGTGGAMTPIPVMASDASVSQGLMMDACAITTGPSELYRLIASSESSLDWDVILARARSHPGEACFYDPNAGGHVYALHRLLRRTGGDDAEDGSNTLPPPVEVVEAVMQACPRAVTRKQAVIDEDDLMSSSGSVGGNGNNGNTNVGGNGGNNQQQPMNPAQGQLNQLQNMLLNFPPVINAPLQVQQQERRDDDDDDDDDDMPEPPNPEDDNDGGDHDDVRFEYPLAIACECEQDIEIVRLLASYLAKTKPVYRSEVFRSLDYASLPNPVVRILLEEYAGCVLERGMNSEATEGDDDDCPLEQVLFWWDDPDMMGMEEDIANYPNCNMHEDLFDLHEKLRMMLYAATMGTMSGYDSSKESFQVLHHVLRIVSDGGIGDVRFPNDFAHAVLLLAKFIQRERVEMFEERDESGALPLHIAVSGEGLLRQNDSRPRGEEEGDGQEDNADQGAMDGVEQADGHVEGEARQEQGNVLLPQQDQPLAAREEDEDDEEEDDEDDDIEDISTMPSDMEIVRLLLDQHPASIRLRDSQSGSLPIHLALQHNPRATEAIEYFLNLYPRSVTMPDGNGRLPIHTALIQKSPIWKKVLDLSPTAIEARDSVTGLLPFQLAAMSKQEASPKEDDDSTMQEKQQDQELEQDELDSLSTTFRLLRMSPCLASGLADVKPRPQSLIERQIMVGYKPRVAKLEEENEKLRRRVEELELKMKQMMSADLSAGVGSTPPGRPSLKKRKSSCVGINGSFLFAPP